MNEFDGLVSRLKKKYPMLQNFSDRTFGIEIEFFGLDYLITPVDNNIIKPYLISSRAKDGRYITDICRDYNMALGTSRDMWHFEQDTSVRGKGHNRCGAELISPILSGMEGLVQVYKAFLFLHAISSPVDLERYKFLFRNTSLAFLIASCTCFLREDDWLIKRFSILL